MSLRTVIALVLALASTTLTNIAYLREHDAAAALALASLALVQTIGAGGIGVLAYLSARLGGRRLGRRELSGVVLSVVGLVALAVSLAGGSGKGGNGSTAAILLWIGASAAVALLVLLLARRLVGFAVAAAVAGGLFF